MQDLDRALADISVIRGQLAKSHEFQAFGPVSITASGVLALGMAVIQTHLFKIPGAHLGGFLTLWVLAAGISVLMIGVESAARAQRVHGSLALPMLQMAVEHFCPALIAGAVVTLVILRHAPSCGWMLPGLWEVIFSLGAFAMARLLPRPMFLVGAWYLICGLLSLEAGQSEPLAAWSMGVPFGVGQLAVAGILYRQRRANQIDD